MSTNSLERFFSSSDFMPHIHCYLAKPSLVWTMFTTDLSIGISYVIISFSLYRLVRRIQLPFSPMFLAFGLFIFACGLTHFMEVYTLWVPEYWLAAFVKIVTAMASVLTAAFLIHISPHIYAFATQARDSEERRIQLQNQTKELEATQTRFRQMIEGVKDYAIFSLNTEGNIISWNEGAKRIHQYQAHDVINKHFRMLFLDKDIADKKPEKELKEAEVNGKTEEESWRVRKDETKFYVSDVISAIRDEKGDLTGYTVVTRDMTEKRLAQEKLKHAYDEMEERVKERTSELEKTLQSRDDFLSVASHELKTPLTAIFMQLQLLQRRLQRAFKENKPLAPIDLQKLDVCLDQSLKLSTLIEELLDLTRIRAGRLNLSLEEIDLGKLVEEVIERLNEPLLKDGKSRIKIHAPMEGLVGEWDRMRLEQIITNLISNALKYGDGKPITITLESVDENSEIKLIVKDEGIGMNKDLQKKIFERFARGSYDNKISGLGLGLYITRQIIEAHHGRVELESSEGNGSEFKIFLPAHPQIYPQVNQDNKGDRNEVQEHSHH